MHQMQSPLHFICEVSAYAKYTSKCSANIYSLWRIMPRPYLRVNSSSRGCKSSAKIRLTIYIFTMLFTLFYLGIKYVVYVPTKPSILCSGCTSQEKNVPTAPAEAPIITSVNSKRPPNRIPLFSPSIISQDAVNLLT